MRDILLEIGVRSGRRSEVETQPWGDQTWRGGTWAWGLVAPDWAWAGLRVLRGRAWTKGMGVFNLRRYCGGTLGVIRKFCDCGGAGG